MKIEVIEVSKKFRKNIVLNNINLKFYKVKISHT